MDVGFRARLPAFLLEALQPAKFQIRAPTSFLGGHSRGYVIRNLLFEMKRELGLELSFRQALVPETTKPTHVDPLLSGSQNHGNRVRQLLPIEHFRFQLSPAVSRQLV